MASKLFSFRLPEPIVEVLLSRAEENESLNLTAQRVLMGALGFTPKGVNSLERMVDEAIEEAVSASELQMQIEDIVKGYIEDLTPQINEKLALIVERLEALENPPT